MEQGILDLVEISQYYGRQKDFVLAGGGNTSYKTADCLRVKASGFSLSTITEPGFAKLDRKQLNEINTKNYSTNVLQREEEIKNDLLKSRMEPEKGRRPSVETSLHNLIDYAFIVHTHSTKVNGLMCSNQAEEKAAELFGDDVLYVPYDDPGYILFKVVEKAVLGYRAKKGKDPAVILLQNHGVFVGANSIDEIKAIYDDIIAKLDAAFGDEAAIEELSVPAEAAKIVPAVRMMVSGEGLKSVRLANNSLINYYLDKENYKAVAKPFTPDGIVYANSAFVYAEFTGDVDSFLNDIQAKIKEYETTKGKLPKVIFAPGLGVLLIADHAQGADILYDVVTDSCRIASLAQSFGGEHPMTPEQIQFIENWEVEQYRSKVSLGATAGRVDRKVIVVTGGAQGFGAGIVEELMKHGANVVIADLNEEKGLAFAEELNMGNRKNKALFVKADVSNAASVEQLVCQTVINFGGLDAFISNAGILRAGGLDEMTPETFELMTKVNYSAYFLCAKYASAVMKLQNKFKRDHFTDIIQINSKSGLKGSNKNFAYAGGKFGGIGLTQSFALELMPSRIKVNSICPGNFFDGPLWADPDRGLFVQYLNAGKVPGAKTIDDVKAFYEAQVPAGRGCTPIDVMRAIFYVIEQEYETGQAVPVTGGQNMLN
ncbi:SDR family NAD(P)-dependent oxidoreductase [Mangrovibacterium diazotrophicum]|uniref:Rhamnose utilization protein RhaD (Predicted bifunctional aldolase and dehydrogenase) n=1 Tax=Mangrovibacterium diazotrophicum TaxID=1261403 RepID=A0A419W7S4_9BACT|nr:SDR family NAD(P)-dependent oxidoreductase [Mangrovibacterium diazotrophicum]RKD91508.1 rhamnose utilization protein RhaD (predicted bifunctional aldolase and dehydrogenase) [Mangrovibacterium diazotrophicum]